MNRFLIVVCFAVALASVAQAKSHPKSHPATPAPAAAPGHARSEIAVGRGWPLHRTLPTVVVRPSRVPVRVVTATYLAPVVWHPLIVPRPASSLLVWEDRDHLARKDDWTEMTFNTAKRGSRLFLEVESGQVQLEFAEVVFTNGQARVVDFQENTREQGFYPILDFKEARDVDHVRIVARANSDAAHISLHMQG